MEDRIQRQHTTRLDADFNDTEKGYIRRNEPQTSSWLSSRTVAAVDAIGLPTISSPKNRVRARHQGGFPIMTQEDPRLASGLE